MSRELNNSLTLGLVVGGLITAVLLGSWFVLAADSGGEWVYPESEVEPIETLSVPEKHALPEPIAAADPRDIEISLTTLATLGPGKHDNTGPGSLTVRSFIGKRPIPVTASFLEGPDEGREESISGEVVISGLRLGWHLIDFDGEGYRTQRLVRVRRRRPKSVRLEWNLVSKIEGIVTGPDGTGLENATVVVAGTETKTDREGRFSVAGVIASTGADIPVFVRARGKVATFETTSVMAMRPQSLRFSLEDGYKLTGYAQIPGPEAAEVRIAVLPRGIAEPEVLRVPWFWRGIYHDVPVDSKGRYVIDGLPHGVGIGVGMLHPTYVLDEPLFLTGPELGRARPAYAFLKPKRVAVLSGRVVDHEHKPIAGARVVAGRVRGASWGQDFIAGRRKLAVPGWPRLFGSAMVTTGEDGTYRIGLPWSRTRVRVHASGFVDASVDVPGRRSSERDFELNAGLLGQSGTARLNVGFEGSGDGSPGPLRVHIRRDGRLVADPIDLAPEAVLPLTFEQPVEVEFRWREVHSDRWRGQRRIRVVGEIDATVKL